MRIITIEQIRSFIAIELPDELKRRLGELEARLQPGTQSWTKWVDPNSIHLTLKFLGNIGANRTSEITGAIEEAAQEMPPFRLEVRGLGAFPNLNRVQVVWVGIGGEVDKLSHLQHRIDSSMERLGFTPESRSFTPHFTLARVRDQASLDERQRLGQLIASTDYAIPYILDVNSVSLMRSQLTRAGATYTRIGSVKLGNPLSRNNP